MAKFTPNPLPPNERRRCDRVPYATDMHFRSGARAGLGTVVDISSHGMFFTTPTPPNAGDRLQIDFRFRNSRAAMQLCGEITRTTPSGAGVRFLW